MHELKWLKNKLNELKVQRHQSMETGQLKDYAAYRQVVGELTGLTLAIREIEDLQHNIERANDDFDD